jgi:type 2A phosphatase activator TIP41
VAESLTCAADCREDVKELNITYDWTYTTDYKGSLQRLRRHPAAAAAPSSPQFERSEDVDVETTDARIDYEKLKEREPILWFEEVGLYEDELHDHGVSAMNVKVVRGSECSLLAT